MSPADDPGRPTVAVLGTGRMGSAMAERLAATDVRLVLYNRTRAPVEDLAGQVGARVAETPAAAAQEADVSLTMLADQAAVEAIWDGPAGILAGARPESVLVDMSTVPPATLRAFAERARAAGAGILDAPVSGSVPLAKGGQLTIMVGGDEVDVERARPIFERLATKVTHIGPLGSGAALKLAVNTLIFALNQGIGEALVLAERAGIDREVAYDVFASSAAGAPYVGYKRPAFLDPDTTPVAFSLALAEKDLHLILGFAEELHVPMAQARVDLELVQAAAAHHGPDSDASAIASHLRQIAAQQQKGIDS